MRSKRLRMNQNLIWSILKDSLGRKITIHLELKRKSSMNWLAPKLKEQILLICFFKFGTSQS